MAALTIISGFEPAKSQDVGRARVTYVSGDNVYLDIGRDAGLVPGDTLTVVLPNGQTQMVLVRSAMHDRSVLEISNAVSKVETGDEIRILADGISGEEVPQDPSPPPLSPRVTGEVESTDPLPSSQPVSVSERPGPEFEGRIMLGFRSLRSETSSPSGPSVGRVFLTPWTALQVDGRQLPFDLRFRTHLRGDYRYSDRDLSTPDLLVRAYEVLLEKDFAASTVVFGRFSNRYAISGGYWDGLLVEYGPGETGVGASAGFLPELSNGSISTDSPKLAVFGWNRHRLGSLLQRVSGWYQEIFLSDGRPTRRNLGLSHRATASWVSSDNRIELDRDPSTGEWTLTRGSFQLTGRTQRWLGLRARYEIRRPYSMYRSFAVISYRRDQMSAGASFNLGRATLSGDLVWNYSYRIDGGRDPDGRSARIYAGVTVSPTTHANATGSYWTSANGNSTLMTLGASRSMGRLHLRMNYQFSRSTRFDTDAVTHLLSVGLATPLSRRIRTISDFRIQGGSNIFSTAFSTTVTVTL